MGIAGLARHLEPYAVQYDSSRLGGHVAIIDGPSLAYHALKLALAASEGQSHLPSYADVNTQALDWLKALEGCDIQVYRIFFDGALPDDKVDERLSRLQQSAERVRQLSNSHSTAACPVPVQLGSVNYSLLAPALVEALIWSDYGALTCIVPGEAENCCAEEAQKHKHAVIFSDDTDALLFNHDVGTCVMFFRDIQLLPEPVFRGYEPAALSERLHIPSLAALAYCLTCNRHKSFDRLLAEARDSSLEMDSAYQSFTQRYTESDSRSSYARAPYGLQSQPQNMDVRISEFVHLALNPISAPVVYLPLLVEDPRQASAWATAQNSRLLAYSLLNSQDLTRGHQKTVREYRRKAERVSGHEFPLMPNNHVVAIAAAIASKVSLCRQWTRSRNAPETLTWTLIATHFVLTETILPPKITLLTQVLIGDFNGTWDFIHLTARIHAAMYSLRMLKQCIAVWLALHQNNSSPPRQHINSLDSDLETMPTIADSFLVSGQARLDGVRSEDLRAVLVEMYAAAGIAVPQEQVSNRKQKKQAREAERKKRKKAVADAAASAERSDTIFHILGQRGGDTSG